MLHTICPILFLLFCLCPECLLAPSAGRPGQLCFLILRQSLLCSEVMSSGQLNSITGMGWPGLAWPGMGAVRDGTYCKCDCKYAEACETTHSVCSKYFCGKHRSIVVTSHTQLAVSRLAGLLSLPISDVKQCENLVLMCYC